MGIIKISEKIKIFNLTPEYWHYWRSLTFDIQSLAEAKDFSSLCVKTRIGADPAPYPLGTRGLSPGVKEGWGVTLTIHSI